MRGTLTNFVVLVVLLWLGHAGLAVAQTDPLPSWREGPAKAAILDFVARTTTTVQTTWGQCVVASLVAVVEMVLRLHESIYAPLYALFLVGPITNLIDIWWQSRQPAPTSAPHPA